MEWGELADRALDEVGAVRVVARVDVDVGRHEQLGRRVGVLAEDRLAADHDDLGVSGDRRRGPDDVLELRPVHRRPAPSRTRRQIDHRVLGSRTPAKGEVCRI